MKKEDLKELKEAAIPEEEVAELYEKSIIEERKPTKKNSQASADEKSKGSGKPKTGKAANSRYVRVRKGASESSQVVTIMNLGDQADILDRVPGYYKVQTKNGGHVGFVASTYFKED